VKPALRCRRQRGHGTSWNYIRGALAGEARSTLPKASGTLNILELYSRGVSGRSPLYAAEGSGDTELKFIRPEIDTFKIFLKIVMDTDTSTSRATPGRDNRIIWRIIRLFFVIEILIFALKDLFS